MSWDGFTYGPLRFSQKDGTIYALNIPLKLTLCEWVLLFYLMTACGGIVSKDLILPSDAVTGRGFQLLRTSKLRLERKLRKVLGGLVSIECERRCGYRLSLESWFF